VGLFGEPNVEKMKARKNVRGLIKALGYQKDYGVRRVAAEALGEIGDPRAVDPLTNALNDDKVVRRAAIRALGEIGAPAVVPLTNALKDGKEVVRGAAAEVLVKIGAPAVEPLIAALTDKHEDVRWTVAEALDKIGWLPDEGANGVAYWVAKREWDQCVLIGAPRAVAPLTNALKDDVVGVREAAAKALGKIGDPRAVEPLILALKNDARVVREAAAFALGKIGAPAVEPLTNALKDNAKVVRLAAAFALVEIGGPAVEPLTNALKDEKSEVRKVAAEVLGKIGWLPDAGANGVAYWVAKKEWARCVMIGEPAVEPLTNALKDDDVGVREAAAKALGEIGAPAMEPLIAALTDKHEDVRWIAAEALDKIGWLPDERANGAAYWVAKREWDQCVMIGAPAAEPLIDVLQDKAKDVRWAAAEALDKIGWLPDEGDIGAAYWVAKREWDRSVKIGAPAVEPLTNALKDRESAVREAAARALGKIDDPRALEPLIAALQAKESDVRKAAARALGRIGDPRAVEPIIAALKDDDKDVRCAAAYALDRIGDPRAVEPLILALKDDDKDVRRAAANALVGLYQQTGHLDRIYKKNILSMRHMIENRHTDRIIGRCYSDCHRDPGTHEDKGIGVSFPV
jgi:HEAT repeat protein